MEREEVVSSAKSFLKTPWAHAGRIKGVGVDCTGLIICSLNENGAEIPDKFDYALGDEFYSLLKILKSSCYTVNISEILPGDIILFRAKDMYNHVGMFVGENKFIHSYSDPAIMRVTISRIDNYWRERIHSIHSYNGFRR
jgi:cell wall-associated NlpC family hydrolase